MELLTRVHIPRPSFHITHQSRMMLLGSCFAESIGEKLESNKFKVDCNPAGIVYNPFSVSLTLRRVMREDLVKEQELFFYDGAYHSYSHHSRFSSPEKEMAIQGMNSRLQQSGSHLHEADLLIITFGTSYVYRLKSSGEIVANCHKQPGSFFQRTRLTPEEISSEWMSLLEQLFEINPGLNIVFTVSPVRHWSDGAHANQLSKSILLLSIEQLLSAFPGQTAYFPSYEILLDELRDYRFYADDMCHPSPLAVQYIWEKFAETYISPASRNVIAEWEKIRKAVNHRPFQPDSTEYKTFLTQTLLKAEEFGSKFPYFDITGELELLRLKTDQDGI